jgi:heptosyltransferase-3
MPLSQQANIHPKRILVITLRYLGDTLLVTPLISALKKAYPEAEIDVLLPAANIGMLEGNSEISQLIPMLPRPNIVSFIKLLMFLCRQYDVSISTQAGDRPVLCAAVAGKFSISFVPTGAAWYSWKRLFLNKSLNFDALHGHTVLENLRFCEVLGIPPCYQLTPPRSKVKMSPLSHKYAVMHVMPQWQYKRWHEEGWVALGHFLVRQGLQLVLSGSSAHEEQEILLRIKHKLPPATLNLSGKLSLPQLTELITRADLFIGPDTGITHLAAATGTLTFAIYGPTDPIKWAPWPYAYHDKRPPFVSCGSQQINNVCLIQGVVARGCVPCQQEGCEKSRISRSECLDILSTETVIERVRQVYGF